jgi:hypothetical protein
MQEIYTSAKPKEGRRPGHYELIWEIPVYISGVDGMVVYIVVRLHCAGSNWHGTEKGTLSGSLGNH